MYMKGDQSPYWQTGVSSASSSSFRPPILNCCARSTSWYKPGQTPGSVLGEVSSSMEECRAETVSLFRELSYQPRSDLVLTLPL